LKLLILRTGAMGDIVHSLHAAAALRAACPDWTLHWLADERWAPLLTDTPGHLPVTDRLITAPVRSWSREPFGAATRQSLARLRHSLRAERYDLAVDLQGTIRSGLLGFFSGAKTLAGWTDPREYPARWFYHEAIPREGRHFVEQTTNLLAAATRTPLVPRTPPLPAPEVERLWAEGRREHLLAQSGTTRLAILAPGAGWAAKQWPAAHYAELAQSLHDRGFAVAINCAHAGNPLAQEIAGSSSSIAVPVPTNLAELTALLRVADLVVGGDSGPLHLAAALGRPLVGLYGPTDPARNGPYGTGSKAVLRHESSVTSYKHTATPDPGLRRIHPADVLAAIDRLLPRL
jgi:heptosyltransferase I